MRTKIKIKRRKKINMLYFTIPLILVIVLISTSYSLWHQELTINGIVTGYFEKPQLPVEIKPAGGTTTEGDTRYTTSASFAFLGRNYFDVVSENYEDNKITTTIKQARVETSNFYLLLQNLSPVNISITLKLDNNYNADFTDGTISMQSYDPAGIVKNAKGTLSSTTILQGNSANIQITGTLSPQVTVATGTYYLFEIRYKMNGQDFFFYYQLNISP